MIYIYTKNTILLQIAKLQGKTNLDNFVLMIMLEMQAAKILDEEQGLL